MRKYGMVLLTCVVCHMTLIDQSEAMYGLCSTDWMSDDSCFDNNDECNMLGGRCFHDGNGDHGEGCVCKKEVRQGSSIRWVVLVHHHIPLVGKLPNRNKPFKYT